MRYIVPYRIVLSGHADVEADDAEDALKYVRAGAYERWDKEQTRRFYADEAFPRPS